METNFACYSGRVGTQVSGTELAPYRKLLVTQNVRGRGRLCGDVLTGQVYNETRGILYIIFILSFLETSSLLFTFFYPLFIYLGICNLSYRNPLILPAVTTWLLALTTL